VATVTRPGSGDGFVRVADGSVRWGIYGAAGVLFRHRPADGEGKDRFFVALRAGWTHQGGTWSVPGGALDAGEDALEGALREFAEEIGLVPRSYDVAARYVDDHGGWSYTTILVDVPDPFPPPRILRWETDEVAWVSTDQLHGLDLHPSFRAALRHLL
jgi:8-oxo-dGTP pyrophosphatase MutT (NUDIX family)